MLLSSKATAWGGIPFYNKRNFLSGLENLTKKGKIVVIATQVMLEGSDAEVYEVGYKAVNSYNVLQAYDMTVEAAAVKLMWIMGQTRDFETVKKMFYTKSARIFWRELCRGRRRAHRRGQKKI